MLITNVYSKAFYHLLYTLLLIILLASCVSHQQEISNVKLSDFALKMYMLEPEKKIIDGNEYVSITVIHSSNYLTVKENGESETTPVSNLEDGQHKFVLGRSRISDVREALSTHKDYSEFTYSKDKNTLSLKYVDDIEVNLKFMKFYIEKRSLRIRAGCDFYFDQYGILYYVSYSPEFSQRQGFMNAIDPDNKFIRALSSMKVRSYRLGYFTPCVKVRTTWSQSSNMYPQTPELISVTLYYACETSENENI